MKNNINENFLESIKKSFGKYNKHGARSNKKLIPVHSWFAQEIINKLGNGYSVKSLGIDNGKEYKINGRYYDKIIDITIFYKNKPISVVSVKFVTSNYAQNSNNYFENLLGETANIRRVNIGFAHFLILRGHTPYYDKAAGNKRGKLKKLEILSEKNIKKYLKLFKDVDFPHKPDILGIVIIDFDNKNNPFFVDFKNFNFSAEAKNLLEKEFSIAKFITRIKALCQLKK